MYFKLKYTRNTFIDNLLTLLCKISKNFLLILHLAIFPSQNGLLMQNHIGVILTSGRYLKKDSCRAKLLNQHFCCAQVLCVRPCLIKQACQSLLSLNQHFLTVYNIYAAYGVLNHATLKVVNSFHLSVFRFHLFYACHILIDCLKSLG